MSDAASIELPAWACVKDKRRAHIARVTELLAAWATAMELAPDQASMWREAGLLHDALRDAPEPELRRLTGGIDWPEKVLHGPAAAARLRQDGEQREELLDAIRWHTLGFTRWGRCGRALYMADYLEPGRPFAKHDRAFLAAQVPRDFDGVFRQVVRQRLEWSLRENKALFPETVALWNDVR